MKTASIIRLLTALFCFVAAGTGAAQGTAFTYQGRLTDNGQPAQGVYDLQFKIYDAATGGGAVGTPVVLAPIAVTNGLFTVTLDFGAGAFDGSARWLEIGVRTNGSAEAHTVLSPRQPLTSTPYAVRAITAGTAASVSGAVPAAQISGMVAPSQIGAGTISSAVTLSHAGNVFNGTFTGNGAGLTNVVVSASQITGTLMPSNVPELDASKLTSGTLDSLRLPNLDAAKITSGTLADGLLPANMARLNAQQTFTGSNTFSGVVTLTNATNTVVGTFTGDGSGLTNLVVPASHLTGTIGSSQIGAGAVGGAQLAAGSVTTTSLADSVVTDAKIASLAAGKVAGTLMPSNIPDLDASKLTSGTLDSLRLPNLDAAKITSGTLADGLLPANMARLNAHQTFTGSNVFSGVMTLTNATNTVVGTFTGDGSAITNLNAMQLVGTVPLAQLPGVVVTNNASGVSLNGTFAGDGGGITNVRGTLAWQTVSGTTQQAAPNTGYVLTDASPTAVTLPSSANVGDIVRVSGTGAGGWLVMYPWTARENSRWWNAVASSSDGTKLVAVVGGGQIYTSTDSGTTWTARESDRSWYSVASSADGTKLVAVADGSQIYTSTDSGATWTPRESSRKWTSVASSADGTELVAVVYFGQIYTSTDSGVTWTARESSREWYSVASSADGTKLVAVVFDGQIYTSTNAGATWTARESNRYWHSVASSADGTKLVAVVNLGGQIYTSADSGVTWTSHEDHRYWKSVASSADGTKLVAVVYGGQIYASTDSGVTWTAR